MEQILLQVFNTGLIQLIFVIIALYFIYKIIKKIKNI